MKILSCLLFFCLLSCNNEQLTEQSTVDEEQFEEMLSLDEITSTSLIILGNVQDAGSPHMACTKDCCKDLFDNPDHNRKVVSLGVIDPENKKTISLKRHLISLHK